MDSTYNHERNTDDIQTQVSFTLPSSLRIELDERIGPRNERSSFIRRALRHELDIPRQTHQLVTIPGNRGDVTTSVSFTIPIGLLMELDRRIEARNERSRFIRQALRHELDAAPRLEAIR